MSLLVERIFRDELWVEVFFEFSNLGKDNDFQTKDFKLAIYIYTIVLWILFHLFLEIYLDENYFLFIFLKYTNFIFSSLLRPLLFSNRDRLVPFWIIFFITNLFSNVSFFSCFFFFFSSPEFFQHTNRLIYKWIDPEFVILLFLFQWIMSLILSWERFCNVIQFEK